MRTDLETRGPLLLPGIEHFRNGGRIFWLHYGWSGVAAMIALLLIATFGVAIMLLRLPVIQK